MINLEDYIKEIEGVKYVPLDIAQAAVASGINESKLDDAMTMIKNSINDLNNSVNEAFKDD